MFTTNSDLEKMRVGYSVRFRNAFKNNTSQAALLATEVPSKNKQNIYSWIGKLPKMRKWIGELRFSNLGEYKYAIENEKYSAGIEIDEEDFEDDNLGQYQLVIDSWGQNAGSWRTDLIAAALKAGTTSACYDGQNFFDNDHAVTYKDANGQSQTATFVNNYSGSGTAWFLADLSQPLKPIILQIRKEPAFDMLTQVSDHVKLSGKIPMWAKARGAAGYGMWQTIARSTEDLTKANYEKVKKAMATIVDENGDKIGIRPTHIFVGSSNESAAKELFTRATIDGGDSNALLNDVTVVVLKELD